MAKSSFRRLLPALLITTILVLLQSEHLAAQEIQPTAFSGHSDEQLLARVDTASLASLPAAPSAVAAESSALKPAGAGPLASMAVVAAPVRPAEQSAHRFWDRQNCILFAAVGGMATADFFVTRANLASGGRELTPITRVFAGSTPALATNFALETSGVIGLSYVFHKTGHHRLERATSFVNAGASAGAVAYGLTHR